MKKLFMLVLGLSFMITLAACGDDGELDIPEDINDLTPEEIAEKLVEDFDGDLSHLDEAMDSMEFDNGYEMTIEGIVQMSADGNTMSGLMRLTDRMVVDENGFMTYSREQTMSVDGMSYTVEVIVQEVADGVDLYFNVGELIDSLPFDVQGEVQDALGAFNLNADWLYFHFEDSIENVVEVEAMKDFLLFILEDELGEEAYDVVQDELEAELGFDLNQYGVDMPAFGALLEANDYDGLKEALEAVDFEGIQAELDPEMEEIVPGLDPMDVQAAFANIDIEAFHAELETFDFELMLQKAALGAVGFEEWVNTLATDYPEMQALLLVYVPVVEFLEENDALNEIGYIGNNIGTFDPYFDLQTYIDAEFVTVGVEVVDSSSVLTTLSLDPENFHTIFQDFMEDAYWFAYQFPGSDVGYLEHINCPATAGYCDEFDIYEDMESELEGVDPLEVSFLYEPGDASVMTINIDAVDFVESLAAKQGEAVIAQDFGLEMSMKEGAVIDLPTSFVNVKPAVEELLKVQMVQDLYWKLDDINWQMEYMELPYDVNLPVTELDWWMFDSAAIDQDLSTFRATEEGEVYLTLYWRDGGTIFSEEIVLSELDMLRDQFNDDISRAAVEAYLDLINEETFDLGRALLYFMLD